MHHLIRRISEYLVGLLFGFGLILGGMINPSKVIGFLDLLGLWDPSLAFVMGGAVILSYGAFRMTKRSGFSLQGRVIMLDDSKPIDARLLMGSGLFGIGWGLSGFCPGPALASLGTGEWKAALFVMAMILGTWIAGRVKFGMN
jgi:uncharacterized membrane protein YedE/YeeE